jgi:hypothetical protein
MTEAAARSRSTSRVRFPGSRYYPRAVGRSFDVHPDGDRFAQVKASESDAKRDHITLIFNFLDELRRLAPCGDRAPGIT